MSGPRYDSYRDSGVEWLGEVPAHWSLVSLKRLASLASGETITADRIDEVGAYPVFGGNGIRGYTNAYTHDGHFALIGRQGALCGNINFAKGKFWASEHAVVASPKEPCATRWLGELLRSMDLGQYSVSAAQPGISVELISNLLVPVPPYEEQRDIAGFLARETAKIDALLEEQRRLIELLEEKRQAVISDAVTRGLDPAAPMKDSGVEWLGEVPAHWEVAALKRITDEITVGIVVEPSKYYVDDGVPALRSLNVRPGWIRLEDLVYISAEANDIHSKSKLRKGDLVAVRTGQPGTAAVVTLDLDGCNCVDLIIIRPAGRCDEHFLCWYLASDAARFQFSEGSGGAIQQHFNVGEAKELRVTLPPLTEQKNVVGFLERETAKLDKLSSHCGRAMQLLREHRAALISAAVTGKIDVRGAAAEAVAA